MNFKQMCMNKHLSYRLAIGIGALRGATYFHGLACLALDPASRFATVVGFATLCAGFAGGWVGDIERAGRKCDREGTTKTNPEGVRGYAQNVNFKQMCTNKHLSYRLFLLLLLLRRSLLRRLIFRRRRG